MSQKEIALAILLILGSQGSHSASLIDANFKQSRMLQPDRSREDTPRNAATNDIGVAYKSLFARSMYSACRWFPSDSEFLKISSQRCGPTRGTVLAFARFMSEHDAERISQGIVVDQNRIRFLGLSNDCNLL